MGYFQTEFQIQIIRIFNSHKIIEKIDVKSCLNEQQFGERLLFLQK